MQQRVHRHLLAELRELFVVGSCAVDQHVADLGEPSAGGDLFDRIAAVAQDALFAVDERDRALAAASVPIPRVQGDQPSVFAQLGNVDSAFPFATFDYRQFVLFSFVHELGSFHAGNPKVGGVGLGQRAPRQLKPR